MSDWETKKLKDLAIFSQGIQIDLDEHKKVYEKNYVPFLRIENYTQKSNDLRYVPKKYAKGKMVSKNDIVVVRYGASSGFIGHGHDGILANNLFKVEPNQLITKDYLYLILKSSKTKRFIQRAMFGGAMPAISFGLIGAVEVKYPNSITVQNDIVAKFDVWDTVIEKTEALIDAKERQFGWLCQKFFTPDNDLTSSWQRRKIGDFVKQRKEKSQPTEYIPLYSLTIENGVTEKTDRYNREFLVKDKGNKTYKVVHPNDIVFNPANLRWGAIARSEVKHKVVLSPIYEVYKILDEEINADFLKYALTCKRQVAVFATKTEGTLIERMAVKADVFELCEISVPQDKEQQKNIAHILNTAQQEITLLKKLADQYRTQKRGLMQKLLSGQWHIKNKETA